MELESHSSCALSDEILVINNAETKELDADIKKSFSWLYEKLLPESLRELLPQKSYKSFIVHTKDSYNKFPDPQRILNLQLKPFPKKQFRGKMTYVGFFKKKYRYDVFWKNNELVIEVKIGFKGSNVKYFEEMAKKIELAQNYWNQHKVELQFPYRFSFRYIKFNSKEKPHFIVDLLSNTRGPYDQFWNYKWSYRTISHEIGHMLGLGDEYKTLSGKIDCFRNSLMCASGSIMDYHYYFVLRRLISMSTNH